MRTHFILRAYVYLYRERPSQKGSQKVEDHRPDVSKMKRKQKAEARVCQMFPEMGYLAQRLYLSFTGMFKHVCQHEPESVDGC